MKQTQPSFAEVVREFWRGNLDLSALPASLATQVRAMLRRMQRQAERAAKRENKHAAYGRVGLNGPRAVARRLRQIEAGSLRVQNGLCEFGWVAQ